MRRTREELRGMSSAIDNLMDLGKREAARQLLSEALQASAQDQAYNLFFQAEEALYLQNDHRRREQLLAEGLKAAPDDAFLLRNLGGGYLLDERFTKARRLFEQALEKEPRDADTLRSLGLLYSMKGKETRAIEWFKKALEIKTNDNDSMRQIGVCYSKLGQDRDAIGWYEKALECCSHDYDAMRQMGISTAMLGDYEAALTWLNQALAVNANDLDSKRNLRLVLQKKTGKGNTLIDTVIIRVVRKLTLAWRRFIDRLET